MKTFDNFYDVLCKWSGFFARMVNQKICLCLDIQFSTETYITYFGLHVVT